MSVHLSGKEKIYYLLGVIVDERNITPKGQPLKIDPSKITDSNYSHIDLSQIFTKLANDENVLKIIKVPNRTKQIDIVEDLDPYERPYEEDDGCWHIELLSTFDDYFLKIQHEPEYQEFTGNKPPVKKQAKLSRKSLEKIWGVLQEIEVKRGITSTQNDISIPLVDFSKARDEIGAINASDERRNILRKLENEENAIKDVRFPDKLREYVYLKIGDNYFEVYDYYEKEYKKAAKDHQQSQRPEETSTENPAYEVKYSERARKILINNFLVKQPRSFSDNEAIFVYLYKNPNQDKSIDDIKKGTGLASVRDLNKFVENIGFVGDLRKVFFKVAKNTIRFNNPITKEDLKELGIDNLRLG